MPSIQKLKQAVLPTEQDVALARESGRRLASLLGKNDVIQLHVGGSSDQPIEVPSRALSMLVDVLSYMGSGDAVGLVTVPADLTTQRAADFLNVSRSYLDSLLQAQAIPFHASGTHKRISLRDLIRYKAQLDVESKAALDALATQAQELDLGY
ncbi:excisionase family DNA-binding protein [Dyella ginsengisoli]|uniref:Excisionase family DNA-binding protein n=1 Tax=Dyella ginsengisoli TaxID=363848 RepID=A0ABW8JY07_9GAMM